MPNQNGTGSIGRCYRYAPSIHHMSKNSKKRKVPTAKPTKRRPTARKVASAGYSKRSLAEKLGMKLGASKAILEAPVGFDLLLGTHEFDQELDLDSYDFIHFFGTSALALKNVFPVLSKRLKSDGMLWISWPKKSSGQPTDLTEDRIRDIGLANGLVDVKVCAVDETWSGLKFVYRLKDR